MKKKSYKSVIIQVDYDTLIKNGYYIVEVPIFGILAKATSIEKVIQEFKNACEDRFDEHLHITWKFCGLKTAIRKQFKELKKENEPN